MSIVNQIQIYEDVLSPDLVKICLKKLSQPKWGFVGGGSDRRFWHMEGLEQDSFFSEDFFGIIQMLTGRTLLVERIYANGQTACQDGISHVDNDRSDAYTFVYFPNPVWDSSHGGNLLFMDSHYGEIIHAVSYRPNRGVFFPAKNLYHMAQTTSKWFGGLRVSIGFKLIKVGV